MKQLPFYVCLAVLLLVMTVATADASPVITNIYPATAPNTGDVTVTITGTGFNDQSTVWLDSPFTVYKKIPGTIGSWTPTTITSTFSLNGVTPARYNIYVNSPFTAYGNYYPQDVGKLSLGFTIYQGSAQTATTTTTPVTTTPSSILSNGSIFVSSFPSGANIYLDNEYKGLAPLTIKNIENGRHVVLVRLAGYEDWIKNVWVYGDSSSLSAGLVLIPATTTATGPTTIPTSLATTRKTVSPLGLELGIIAVMGAALLLVKRK